MRKIPTLFLHNEHDRRHVTSEPNPECRWVLDGEGVATRKLDGTSMMYDGGCWWARREVKPGKAPPDGFRLEQHDATTGKDVGYEPAEQSPWARYLGEALPHADRRRRVWVRWRKAKTF